MKENEEESLVSSANTYVFVCMYACAIFIITVGTNFHKIQKWYL